MVFLLQLLHVLWCRTASTGLEESATSDQRNHGKHLRGSAQLHDGEEVREVITQHVAGDGDGVLTLADAVDGDLAGFHRREDADIQTIRIVILQVLLDLGGHVAIMCTGWIQPEDGGNIGGAGAGYGQLYPVLDGNILGLAGAPDITGFHIVLHEHVTGLVDDLHLAVSRDLEGLIVRAVLLGLLRHQAHVGNGAHGGGVESAILAAIIDNHLVDARVRGIRKHRESIFQLIIRIPHLAGAADHGGHGGIHDHIGRNVQVGDALAGVHLSQSGAILEILIKGSLDLFAIVQILQALEDGSQTVFAVQASLHQLIAVLLVHVREEGAHSVAEDDGVRDLHHGGFQVHGEQHILHLGAGDLRAQEGIQSLGGKNRGIHDLIFQHWQGILQHGGVAVCLHQLEAQLVIGRHDYGLLVVAEIIGFHGGHVGLVIRRPLAHGVRVLAREVLHGLGSATVRVALAQHGVHGGTLHAVITLTSVLFLIGVGLVGEVGEIITSILELLDGSLHLRHGGRDVGELHDVGIGGLRQLAELCESIQNLLVLGELVIKRRQDAGGQGNIPSFHFNARGGSKRLHDWLQRVRGQQRRFVCAGVDDLCHEAFRLPA